VVAGRAVLNFDVETIRALGELGVIPILGFILWTQIKIRKRTEITAVLEKKIDEQGEQIMKLSQSVARIEGHLKIH
jgi:hypothetical protein